MILRCIYFLKFSATTQKHEEPNGREEEATKSTTCDTNFDIDSPEAKDSENTSNKTESDKPEDEKKRN